MEMDGSYEMLCFAKERLKERKPKKMKNGSFVPNYMHGLFRQNLAIRIFVVGARAQMRVGGCVHRAPSTRRGAMCLGILKPKREVNQRIA